jgi:hypothetical protein
VRTEIERKAGSTFGSCAPAEFGRVVKQHGAKARAAETYGRRLTRQPAADDDDDILRRRILSSNSRL